MRLLLLTLCIILFGGNTLRLEAKKYFFSNYNFCHITEEAGLPNNSVTAVMKDSFGYIWVATQDGLARYDGYRFLSYGVKEPLYRLKGNYVYTLCEDRQKRLWVGSDAGLDLIDLQTGLSLPASDLGAVSELSSLFKFVCPFGGTDYRWKYMGSNRQDAVVSGTGLFRSRDGFLSDAS